MYVHNHVYDTYIFLQQFSTEKVGVTFVDDDCYLLPIIDSSDENLSWRMQLICLLNNKL